MRHRNDHLRKVCDCARRSWPKCDHPWHFNFKPVGGPSYRFSLERQLGRPITSKTEAEAARDRILADIREGTFRMRGAEPAPDVKAMTVADLMTLYGERVIATRDDAAIAAFDVQKRIVGRTAVPCPVGPPRPLGDWRLADVTADALEQFRDLRAPFGKTGTNRTLGVLQACFSWAASKKRAYVDESPFRDGDKPSIERFDENARTRRLEAGEDARLLAACGTDHLRAIVEAALESSCRRGELLTLQWWQVTLGAKPEIFLPAVKTKTRTDRKIPVSARLKAILEMRRTDAAGEDHPGEAYVFGTPTGEPVTTFQRAWNTARLKAHGHTPTFTKGANLSPESRAALKAINLHFHDLRRECASRWLDAGLPLHTIQRWLGHTNISQTSTYLAVSDSGHHDAMAKFDQARGLTAPAAATSSDAKPASTAPAASSDQVLGNPLQSGCKPDEGNWSGRLDLNQRLLGPEPDEPDGIE